MPEYEPPIQFTDFTDPLIPAEQSPQAVSVGISRSHQARPQVNSANLRRCGIVRFWLETPGKTTPDNKGQFRAHAPVAAGAEGRWHFAPRVEAALIRWKLQGRLAADPNQLAHPVVLKLELFTRRNATAIWEKTMKWKAGECPVMGATAFNGVLQNDIALKALRTGDVAINYPDAAMTQREFPGNVLTVDRSPYKLKLSIVSAGEPRAIPAMWIYFDVLAHSLDVTWGVDAMAPQTRTDNIDKRVHQTRILKEEKTILGELSAANPKPAPGAVHKVILTSNLFAIRQTGQSDTEEMYKTNTDFDEYQKMWDQGARIPLRVRALIRTSQNTSTDQAPEALGRSRILWDWDDSRANRWQDPLAGGAAPKTSPFLRAAYADNSAAAKPIGSSNCPVEFGGKRGDPTSTVFPPLTATAQLPNDVAACPTRAWAAFSTFGAAAPDNDRSGILFQPSRMAGDTYNLCAYLYYDWETDSEAAINAPAQIKSGVYTFKVMRRIHVFHIVRGTNAELACNPTTMGNTMKTHFENEVDMILELREIPVDNAAYTSAITRAIDVASRDKLGYGLFPGLPLLLRNVVDPAANTGAGLPLVDRDEFERRLEDEFRRSTMRQITALPSYESFLFENVTTASGAKSTLLKFKNDLASAPPIALIPPGGAAFGATETLTGEASRASGTATVSSAISCWGHEMEQRAPTVRKPDSGVTVNFVGSGVVHVSFSRSVADRMKGRANVTLSEKARKDLKAGLLLAASAQDETKPMKIQLFPEETSNEADQRVQAIKDYLDQLFSQQVVIDRKAVLARMKEGGDLVWSVLNSVGFNNIRKNLADTVMLEWIFSEYVRAVFPSEAGVFLFHIAGESNAHDLPILGLGAGYKPAAVSGAIMPRATGARFRCVVYMSTIDPSKASTAATKSAQVIFPHELGHALYLPHAPGTPDPPGTVSTIHVAGDDCIMNYDMSSAHFCGFCMLRMRGWNWKAMHHDICEYDFNLLLELGDVDELFANPANTDAGLKERLQVLGLFSHPLDHPEADDCLTFSLRHAAGLFPGLTKANAGAMLKPEIEKFIVEKGVLPAPGSFAKIRLPKNRVLDSQFSMKCRFPEETCLRSAGYQKGNHPNEQPYAKYMLGADPFQVDLAVFNANPALGKIPLVATVKKRLRYSGIAWNAAPAAGGADVYFSLASTDRLPAYAASAAKPAIAGGVSYHEPAGAPALNDPPKKLLEGHLKNYKPSASNDPQYSNVHEDFGGTRRVANDTVVFCSDLAGGFARLATAFTGSKHPHAVHVTADAHGVAKAIFAPSPIGGDTYKILAYVGDPTTTTLQRDSGGDHFKKTGTMVRWRTVRISRHLTMKHPASSAELPPQLTALTSGGNSCGHSMISGQICSRCMLKKGDQPPAQFDSLATELARCYCELILEPKARTPEDVSSYANAFRTELARWLAAYTSLNRPYWVRDKDGGQTLEPYVVPMTVDDPVRRRAVVGVHREHGDRTVLVLPKGAQKQNAILTGGNGSGPMTVKTAVPGGVAGDFNDATGQVRVLFTNAPTQDYVVGYFPTNFLDFNRLLYFPQKSPALFNLHVPGAYNSAMPALPLPYDATVTIGLSKPESEFLYLMDRAFGPVKGLMTAALCQCVDDNRGFMPGFVVIQAAALDTYGLIWGDGQQGKNVGVGTYLFHIDIPPDQDPAAARNALSLHEISHGLYMVHAPPVPDGVIPARHDLTDVCVMTYSQTDGDYCGKCVASMRGMNIDVAPFK